VSGGELASPSPFLLGQLAALGPTARLGPAVDVACGRGRHSLALAARGLRCLALDRNREALAELAARARSASLPIHPVAVDLERPGSALPLAPGRAGAVVVFRYLWRPLAPALAALLAPGGLLIYETFTRDQEKLAYGPRNPAFLLRSGELPELFPGLRVRGYEEGIFEGEGRPAALARLVAERPG
jgi:SAM-dependent methyltransferase